MSLKNYVAPKMNCFSFKVEFFLLNLWFRVGNFTMISKCVSAGFRDGADCAERFYVGQTEHYLCGIWVSLQVRRHDLSKRIDENYQISSDEIRTFWIGYWIVNKAIDCGGGYSWYIGIDGR